MMEKKPKCNECPWLGYIDSETSFDAFDVCVAANRCCLGIRRKREKRKENEQ